MSGMLFLMFVQSLFQVGAKEGIWEGYYGDKNYLDMFFVNYTFNNLFGSFVNIYISRLLVIATWLIID